jgi:hypothetical protein
LLIAQLILNLLALSIARLLTCTCSSKGCWKTLASWTGRSLSRIMRIIALLIPNKVRIDVFVIANEESGGLGCKYQRHDNGGFSSESHEEIFPPLSMQPSYPDSCNDDVVLADLLDSSQVSGSTSEADSLSLTKDVVERYLLVEMRYSSSQILQPKTYLEGPMGWPMGML